MRKYLISIEDDESPRIKRFYAQNSFLKYKSDFIQCGVIGKKLPVMEYFQQAVVQHQVPLSPSELGCTLSHIEAIKDFIESDSNYALIFEDDAIQINSIDLNSIESEVDNLNLKPCFFISLGGIKKPINNRVRGGILGKQVFGVNVLKIHPFCIEQLSFAFAYLVDKEMAKTLLEYHQVPHVWDHWGALYKTNSNVIFYAVDLFDHPDISENTMLLSHLEDERELLNYQFKVKKSLKTRLYQSMMKRWLKLFYEKYE